MLALSFSVFKHPFTLIYVGGGPMLPLYFSVFKHPFMLICSGGAERASVRSSQDTRV